MFCSICGDDRRFERPPCADGHGDECPELACTDCGAAVLTGGLLPSSTTPPAERSTPVPSRAA